MKLQACILLEDGAKVASSSMLLSSSLDSLKEESYCLIECRSLIMVDKSLCRLDIINSSVGLSLIVIIVC
jgi:hypothetical protein